MRGHIIKTFLKHNNPFVRPILHHSFSRDNWVWFKTFYCLFQEILKYISMLEDGEISTMMMDGLLILPMSSLAYLVRNTISNTNKAIPVSVGLLIVKGSWIINLLQEYLWENGVCKGFVEATWSVIHIHYNVYIFRRITFIGKYWLIYEFMMKAITSIVAIIRVLNRIAVLSRETK